ncbi:DUF2206 domain-containing protein [Thermococcus sp. SY098]|uniref:DUF2206 domain-containing protein n=1 Tax=Thermococcus sp. SY098 TaxID=3111325 RepID=UPI002D76F27B|nr:DUF2206 domain-containing protein [Thermococcus sp. SY098]WRS52138.1 DUF2206 domain-containing protein [Thermococcus sp. SY098]
MEISKRNILIIVLSIQISFIGAIGLEKLDINIPYLRQIIGFIYLTFVPGVLLLGILKIDNIDFVEYILYSVGLSLSFLMLVGIIRIIFQQTTNIIITLIILTTFLVFFYVLNNNNNDYHITININTSNIVPTIIKLLILLLLPIISFLGSYLLRVYNNNTITLSLFFIISLIPLLVSLSKQSQKNYPLILWTITFSLTFYSSLSGVFPHVTDNVHEYAFLVSTNKAQNSIEMLHISSALASMGSVSVLIPLFKNICETEIIWIYRIGVPLLFSFIPPGLYKLFYKINVDKKLSFFSSFFFLSMFISFLWSSVTMKMTLAGLFMLLLILLMFEENINISKKSILNAVFMFSLIISHYGTAYIFLFSSLCLLCFSLIFARYLEKKIQTLRISTVMYFVLIFLWYQHTANGYNFKVILDFIIQFLLTIRKFSRTIFFNEKYSTKLLLGNFPIYFKVLIYLYILMAIFIVTGIIKQGYEDIRKRTFRLSTMLAIPFFIILILPYLPGVTQYEGGRTWYISSFILAPFGISGIAEFFRYLRKVLHLNFNNTLTFIGIFLCIFLLFNSGFIAEVVWGYNIGPSNEISKPRILYKGSIQEKEYFYRNYIFLPEVIGAKWGKRKIGDKSIYGGIESIPKLMVSGMTPYFWKIGSSNIFPLVKNQTLNNDSYLYLSLFSLDTKKIGVIPDKLLIWATFAEVVNFNNILYTQKHSKINKIYSSDGCEIYYFP